MLAHGHRPRRIYMIATGPFILTKYNLPSRLAAVAKSSSGEEKKILSSHLLVSLPPTEQVGLKILPLIMIDEDQ